MRERKGENQIKNLGLGSNAESRAPSLHFTRVLNGVSLLTEGLFLNPPALPRVPVVRFYVGSLSSLAFQRVTRGSAINMHSPDPLLTQV